jgi:predicted nucleic acid-binding protein
MWTLDASVVVRSFDPVDPEHIVCKNLLDTLDARALPVIVPRLLLVELAGAVRRLLCDPVRARLAVQAWQALPHVQIASLEDALLAEAADLAADRALKGADAVYVAVAKQFNCTLVSLDREQRERAAAVVTAVHPRDALAQLSLP